jgi:rifampicin phosphotransferase
MAKNRRSNRTRLIALSEVVRAGLTSDEVGTRTLALADACRLGLPVADSWVLGADTFREAVRGMLPPAHDPASLLRIVHRQAGLERAARARDRLLTLPLPALRDELFAFWDELGPRAPWGLAVRASTTCDDDTVVGVAGLDACVLGARGADELERAVREVWTAVMQEGALRYLRAQRIRDVAVAVLIQPLAATRASGLMLTRDPEHPTGLAAEPSDAAASAPPAAVRVVESALGLGALVVNGARAQDFLCFAADGRVLERRAAEKSSKAVVARSGFGFVPIGGREARRFTLSDDHVAALATIAEQLDQAGRVARGVSFWVRERERDLIVCDVRRENGLGYPEGGSPTTVWSRAGQGDSLPSTPTPFTRSLADEFVHRDLGRALAQVGAKIPSGVALVTSVRGRYYFNLSELGSVVSALPGMTAGDLVGGLRGHSAEVLRSQLDFKLGGASLVRLPMVAARLYAEQRRLSEEMQRFEHEAGEQRRWLREMDLAILPDDALNTTLRESHDFFERTARLLLTCTLASYAAHASLRSVIARSAPADAERIAQSVTAGVGDLDSAAPGVALAHVTAIMQKDADARRVLEQGARLPDEFPEGAGRRALIQFLEAYGDRGFGESDVGAPRWGEQPARVCAMIAAGLRGDALDPELRLSHVRVAADRELAALEARLSFVEAGLVRALVSRCRTLARLRERMRVWMARTLSMLRVVALDVDRRMRRLDPSLIEGGALWCRFDELLSAVGKSRADLAPIVRLRRAEHARQSALPDPPETFVGVPPRVTLPVAGHVVLRGSVTSPGIASGPARIVDLDGGGADQLEPGEILVLPRPDLALTPLFLHARAVVCDLGSAQSHAAVVAREYGVPAVFGARGLIASLQNGERLQVDANRGVIERLDARVGAWSDSAGPSAD